MADDEITWRENGAGCFTIGNAGRELMAVDAGARSVRFLSLFERRFVPVDPMRAEKVLTLADFFLGRRLEPGDEIGFDYPLHGKTYRVEAGVASRGQYTLAAWPEEAFPCARVEGSITGWGAERQTTIDAYIGREGEFAGRILCLSFKFTDWPLVTMTLCGVGDDE